MVDFRAEKAWMCVALHTEEPLQKVRNRLGQEHVEAHLLSLAQNLNISSGL